MFRVIEMSGNFYAVEMDEINFSEIENLTDFIESGDLVSYVDDLETYADKMDIDVDDIEIVE